MYYAAVMNNPEMLQKLTLIADIGGTHARFALAQSGTILGDVQDYLCEDYSSLALVTKAFLNDITGPKRPSHGVFAIAAPVLGDHIKLTNLDWAFSTEHLRQDLQFETLEMVNDFTAIAWAIPYLKDSDYTQIGGGAVQKEAPIAILGPGSGLGVAALIPVKDGWKVLPSEAGHVTLAATTLQEERVLDIIRRKFGHASAERVLSGPGLMNVYEAVLELDGQASQILRPEEISAAAIKDPGSLGGQALDLFCQFLGTQASNVALNYDALGGVYLVGGILPKLGESFMTSGFRQRFEQKGRYSGYLAHIPTFCVHRPNPAFVGLAQKTQ